jgi:hypothetical protein
MFSAVLILPSQLVFAQNASQQAQSYRRPAQQPPQRPPYPQYPQYPPAPPVYRQPAPRNQNPYGKTADLPPHLRQNEDFIGTKSWYALGSSSFGYDTISRTNPGVSECNTACQKTIEEPRWALLLQGAVGWGPVKRNNLSFTSHYSY